MRTTAPSALSVPSVAEAFPIREAPRAGVLGPIEIPRIPGPKAERDRLGDALGHGVTADGDGGYKEDRPAYQSRIDRDGSIHFTDKANLAADNVGAGWAGLTLFGHFDITDAVMRALGDDPYAYEKMKIMDETREVRAGMAMADRSARLREAQSKLRGYLEKIWRIGKWTVAQKRRVYFALWDEVAEKGDAELLRAGEEARATIDAFVRARLPPGGPDAYLAEELEELNRIRKSGRRFDPYRAR